MAVSTIKEMLSATLENVWDTVTSFADYSWRSDINQVKIVNDIQFIEYSKSGIATTFTITLCKPYERWEFDIENENISGHWIGIFTNKNGYVEIDFTEIIYAKKFLLKPFLKLYLKKQQSIYLRDLKRKLECFAN